MHHTVHTRPCWPIHYYLVYGFFTATGFASVWDQSNFLPDSHMRPLHCAYSHHLSTQRKVFPFLFHLRWYGCQSTFNEYTSLIIPEYRSWRSLGFSLSWVLHLKEVAAEFFFSAGGAAIRPAALYTKICFHFRVNFARYLQFLPGAFDLGVF